MNKNGKQRLLDISIYTVKILLCLLLVFNAFVFVFYGLLDRDLSVKRETVRVIKDSKIEKNENGDQLVRLTLPENVGDNEYFFFDTRKDALVYIDGELRGEFYEDRDTNIPGGSIKRFYMYVPLKSEDSGAELVIERRNLQEIDEEAPETFVGTYSGAFNYIFRNSGPGFILSFIVLIFSFVAVIVSIILGFLFKHKINMLYGALGIFVIAAWLITDSFLFPFVFGMQHVNGLLSFMFCLIIPLPLGIFLASIQNGRHAGSMSPVMAVAVLNAIVWPVLHFSGILPIYNAINVANAVLVVLSVAGIAILVVDALQGNIEEYRYTFIGFLGFLFGGLFELTSIILGIYVFRESVPIVIGLAFLLTFMVIQEVNDLRKINMEKQRAIDISEAKTRFLASMSHEIRTPINSILGMNEMILRENKDDNIEDYSRNIKASGKMLLMLVNDVLDFTKIEAGKLEITETDFSVSEMLTDVLSLVRERASEKSLELKTVVAGEVPDELTADELRIRQILINYLNNAVKYTETGSITLVIGGSFTDDGYKLELRVKDTGKGIRKEEQEHLFDAFSRADIKANINIEGTGLGLAIVKSIVESMKGEYGVQSEYGKGSEFFVKLPVKCRSKKLLEVNFEEKNVRRADENTAAAFVAPDAKILAVDDNSSNLKIVKLFLRRNGIVPDTCDNGREAIRLCKEKKYDLILLDHMMPEPDGIETLHAIKSDSGSLNKETKTIVLTVNAVAGSRQTYLSEGFDEYLTKPLDPLVLEETVKKMLPEEKVRMHESGTEEGVAAVGGGASAGVEGMDYEAALLYCGGDETFLREIISDVAAKAPERSEKMKACLSQGDYKAYKIDTHSIKNEMATIGLKEFSERAKDQEYAARDADVAFLTESAEGFIRDYVGLCEKLRAYAKTWAPHD